MFESFLSKISHDIGIDLGTANTLITLKSKGIIINEPSVVAVNSHTNKVIEIGTAAKEMVGKTPAHIVAKRPLVDGVVSDFEITEQMLKFFIDKVNKMYFSILPKPRVVIGIPSGVTEVEKRAVVEAAINAGARKAYLIEEPTAAAIGSGLDITDSNGVMIVDIGGGTSEVAVLNLGGIVASNSIRIAGDELTDDIVNYIRRKNNLLIGEKTAEKLKISIGSATPVSNLESATISGRDAISGLPAKISVEDIDIRTAMEKSIAAIVEIIKLTLEETPPELISDIYDTGIYLAGGGALIKGLDNLIQQEIGINVYISENPLECVVKGTAIVLDNIDDLKSVLIGTENEFY